MNLTWISTRLSVLNNRKRRSQDLVIDSSMSKNWKEVYNSQLWLQEHTVRSADWERLREE